VSTEYVSILQIVSPIRRPLQLQSRDRNAADGRKAAGPPTFNAYALNSPQATW
jgi:hypothetical protein